MTRQELEYALAAILHEAYESSSLEARILHSLQAAPYPDYHDTPLCASLQQHLATALPQHVTAPLNRPLATIFEYFIFNALQQHLLAPLPTLSTTKRILDLIDRFNSGLS